MFRDNRTEAKISPGYNFKAWVSHTALSKDYERLRDKN